MFYFISYHGYLALLVLGKDIPLKYVFKDIFLSIVLFNLITIFSIPLVGLTFLVIYMISAIIFSCICKHLGVQFCRRGPVTIVDDIPVGTNKRELCLMVRLVQQGGKWFSSSLALGTDVVADINGRLSSDMPCLHDHTRCLRPSFF